MDNDRPQTANRTVGAVLVILGVGLLVVRFVPVGLDFAWPAFVIIPGLLVLALGLGTTSGSATVVGACLTTVGLILAYQNATDHFESWAYAWTLVWPAAFAGGQALHGARTQQPGRVRAGLTMLTVGLGMFLAGAAFFEGIIGISGRDLGVAGEVALGVLLIGAGLVLMTRRSGGAFGSLARGRRPGRPGGPGGFGGQAGQGPEDHPISPAAPQEERFGQAGPSPERPPNGVAGPEPPLQSAGPGAR